MTGTGPITSQPATNCGLETNEVSLDIHEEETSISKEYTSMDSLSRFAETKSQSNKKANGFQSVNDDNLKPDILGRTGSRITITTEDTGPESFESNNQEQNLCRDASTREDPSGLVFAMAFIFHPFLVALKTLN